MIHNAKIENPIERARGGMASDSEAKMPGATIASTPAMTIWATMPTQSEGESANTAAAIAATNDTTATMRSILPGSVRTYFTPSLRPSLQAHELKGLDGKDDPRAMQLVEVVYPLVEQRRERTEPDDRGSQERQGVEDAP